MLGSYDLFLISYCIPERTTEVGLVGDSLIVNVPGFVAFTKITWYKGSRDNPILEHTSNPRETVYYDEYCPSGTGNCTVSNKGRPSPYGDITIFYLALEDTGYYYYNIEPLGSNVDAGDQYEVYVDAKG